MKHNSLANLIAKPRHAFEAAGLGGIENTSSSSETKDSVERNNRANCTNSTTPASGQTKRPLSKHIENQSEPQIMHPAEIEHYCRMILRDSAKTSTIGIRVALQVSIQYGLRWFPVADVHNGLSCTRKKTAPGGEMAGLFDKFGMAETRLVPFPSYQMHEARLTCRLVGSTHYHGQQAHRLHSAIETYSKTRPNASPLSILLLIGVYVHGISQSNELGRFLRPEFVLAKSASTPGRILNQLERLGLVRIIRAPAKGHSRPFAVMPRQAQA